MTHNSKKTNLSAMIILAVMFFILLCVVGEFHPDSILQNLLRAHALRVVFRYIRFLHSLFHYGHPVQCPA